MKTPALAVMFASTMAFAAPKPQPVYQDAVLKSFRMVPAGESCSGNTSGKVDDSGNVNANTHTNCSANTSAEYTLVIGDQIIVIAPALSGKKKTGVILSLGWSALFIKDTCLYGQLPGAHVLIRSEGGTYHVKAGKRESLYKLVSAE